MSASRVRSEEPPSSSVMVSPMSVEAWRRMHCEAEGVAARVARGLQRRSSECVSDMVVVWLLICLVLARRQGSSVEKLLSTGHGRVFKSLDRVTF
jgi:hypothetical protein